MAFEMKIKIVYNRKPEKILEKGDMKGILDMN